MTTWPPWWCPSWPWWCAGSLPPCQLRGEEAALRRARLPPRQRHHERRQRLLHCHWADHWTCCHRKVDNIWCLGGQWHCRHGWPLLVTRPPMTSLIVLLLFCKKKIVLDNEMSRLNPLPMSLWEIGNIRHLTLDGGCNALWQSFNGRCDIQNFKLCLLFYPRPNISDWFPSHFIRIQIFQINFSVILYL